MPGIEASAVCVQDLEVEAGVRSRRAAAEPSPPEAFLETVSRVGAAVASSAPRAGASTIVVGELIALLEGGDIALVRFPGQAGNQPVRARSSMDLQGVHIGRQVLLVLESDDPALPIVTGVIRGRTGWPLDDQPEGVTVDADGRSLVVTAQDRLVLRCGKASITLTKAGRVVIEGADVLSRSSGANRIKGGSVQLN